MNVFCKKSTAKEKGGQGKFQKAYDTLGQVKTCTVIHDFSVNSLFRVIKGEVQWNNNAIWKVRGDNTNEHGIIVFINSSIDMKNISFKVFSYTLCL